MTWTTYIKRNLFKALGKTAIAVLTIVGTLSLTEGVHGIDVLEESKTVGLVALSTFTGIMIPASKEVLKDLVDDGELDNDYSDLFEDDPEDLDGDDLMKHNDLSDISTGPSIYNVDDDQAFGQDHEETPVVNHESVRNIVREELDSRLGQPTIT